MGKLKPLRDCIVVSRIQEKAKTAGGIYIPDNAKEKPAEGIVFAVGGGRVVDGARVPLEVKSGDHVLFAKYAGTEVEVGGETMLIMREDDLLGVLA
jgi:chaperonin GroES